MASCTTCNTEYADQDEFRQHCKEMWHTYNLKRKVAGLGPITQCMFEEKSKAVEAKGKGKGKGSHLKAGLSRDKEGRERKANKAADHSQQGRDRKANKAQQQAEDESKPRAPRVVKQPETPWTPCRCLFDENESATPEENVEYMQSKYSFFVPDREYLVKPLEMLTMLHEKIYDDSTCIFCNKIFATSTDCLQHMLALGHTRIGTDSNILCGELEPFYDFSNSKSELVTKLKRKVGADKEKDADASTSPTDEEREEKEGEEREAGEANERAADGGEWQDCDDDCSDDDVLEVVECEDEDEFNAVLAEYGLKRTEVLPSGDLRLPNGSVATHRQYAYIYKQRFKPAAETERVQKRLALSLTGTPWGCGPKALRDRGGLAGGLAGGGGRGLHGVHAMACGTRMVKTHQRQVVAILKEQQKQAMRLGIHHNNSNMKTYQKKVQVNLYSWAK